MEWSAENMFFCRILKLLPFKDPIVQIIIFGEGKSGISLPLPARVCLSCRLKFFIILKIFIISIFSSPNTKNMKSNQSLTRENIVRPIPDLFVQYISQKLRSPTLAPANSVRPSYRLPF